MRIEICRKVYDVDIIKKNNRNTYVRVKNGRIVVTTNYLTSKSSIVKLIMDNTDSIIRMIDTDNKKIDKNENFYYFGKKYDVVYGFDDVEISEGKIFVKDKKSLEKYINKKIMDVYADRINYWYNLFEEKIPEPNLKIRKMTSRWGVCNIKNHNVTLNYYLYKYDICCLDYVIVHELSHFIYPNHSSSFWSLVCKYYPKYKECRRMLKE